MEGEDEAENIGGSWAAMELNYRARTLFVGCAFWSSADFSPGAWKGGALRLRKNSILSQGSGREVLRTLQGH
jgi:hypothetical protein